MPDVMVVVEVTKVAKFILVPRFCGTEVSQNAVLGLNSFFHVLANVVYGGLIKTTSLDDLSQSHLLLLQLSLEYT